MLKTKRELAVLIILLLVLGSLFVMAVSRAQLAAHKVMSQNNLKQLGLGVHNWESTYKHIPSGCDDEARHGWMSFIFPYMEASVWYTTVDFDLSWEHPLNRYHFGIHIPYYHSPNQQRYYTQEGYGISSYHANAALMYRGSKVRFPEIEAGLSNALLVGEISGNETPFGYPFNWRVPNYPLKSGPQSFGGWSDGVHFVLADAAVKFIDNGIDEETFRALAQAVPLPANELIERPDRQFQLVATKRFSQRVYDAGKTERTKGGPPTSNVIFDRDGTVEQIDFRSGMVEVERVLREYPSVKTMRIAYPSSKEELERICGLSKLENLCFLHQNDPQNKYNRVPLDLAEVVTALKKLPHLKFLKLELTDDQYALVREALPTCEVIRSSVRAPRIFQ